MYDNKKVLVIGCDQSGVRLKTEILNFLKNDYGMNQIIGEVIDIGTQDERTIVDYPKYAKAVAETIQSGEATIGLLIGGTGVEMAMAANRFTGIRAVASNDFGVIHIARETMDVNVLCLGSRIAPTRQQTIMKVKAFLQVDFQPAGRHQRRIKMLDEIAVPTVQDDDDLYTDIPDSIDQDDDPQPVSRTAMVFTIKDKD